MTLHGAYLAVLQSVLPSLWRGPFSVEGGPLCELGDDGTEGRAEESGAACTKEEEANIRPYGRPTTHCMSRTASYYSLGWFTFI